MPQMNEAALRGLLGLCQRAGKLQSGGDMALAAIRSGKARVGAACGREGRMIAAVCDAGFASRLQALMTEAE